MSFEEFYATHEHQLRSINLPSNLHHTLYTTLKSSETESCARTIENSLEIKKWGNARPVLVAKEDIQANSTCFLLEHIWTCDLNSMASQLKKSPKLVDHLATIFNIPPPTEPQSYFNDSMQLSTIQSFADKKNTDDPKKVLAKYNGDTIISAFSLSLGGEAENEDTVKSKQQKDCSFEEFVEAMKSTENLPADVNENYLRKLYKNFLSRNEGTGTTLNYNWSDEDGMITVYISIPVKATKKNIKSNLSSSSWKLQVDDKVLINGCLFNSVKHDESYWSIEAPGLFCMTLEKVDKDVIWAELVKGETLLSANDILTKSWLKNTTEDMYLTEVLDSMWKFNQTYSIAAPQGGAKQPLWYIMDQFGSAFTHNNIPNFKCSPFFYVKNNKAYSIAWPFQDIKKGGLCTRNFIPQIMANETLEICKIRMKAFLNKNISNNHAANVETKFPELFKEIKVEICKEKKAHQNSHTSVYNKALAESTINKLENFTFVDNPRKADISLLSLDDTVIAIDQDLLPAKEMIENKDYLSSYLKYRNLHDENLYVGSKFILPRDLVEFNNDFENSDLSTYWILKPVSKEIVNIPICVTSQFSRISRLCEAGSISVSKYITDQAVFKDFYFTFSYTVCLLPNKSIYIYKLPLIQLAEEKFNNNSIINEYNTKPLVVSKHKSVSQQPDMFEDLKISINKKVLPHTPDFKWAELEEILFKRISVLSKYIATDVHFDGTKDNVLFSIDVIMTSDLNIYVTDINGTASFPNDDSQIEILNLFAKGILNDNFVMVL